MESIAIDFNDKYRTFVNFSVNHKICLGPWMICISRFFGGQVIGIPNEH